jgi:hypothetical protein
LQSRVLREHLLSLSYNWAINEKFDLVPLVLLRSRRGFPVMVDAGTALWWNKTLWLGMLYKQDLGINATVGIELYDRFSFAYSYHYYTGSLSNVSVGASEIILGLRLGKSKDPAADSRIKELENKNAQLFEKLDILQQNFEAQKKRLDDLNQGFSQSEKDSMKALIHGLQELHLHLDDHKESISTERENHKTDLDDVHHETEDKPFKYRVIVGSFNEMNHAVSMQKIIQRETGMATSVMKNEKTQRFLIYSRDCNNRQDCKGELENVKNLSQKNIIKGEPWIYRVEP